MFICRRKMSQAKDLSNLENRISRYKFNVSSENGTVIVKVPKKYPEAIRGMKSVVDMMMSESMSKTRFNEGRWTGFKITEE